MWYWLLTAVEPYEWLLHDSRRRRCAFWQHCGWRHWLKSCCGRFCFYLHNAHLNVCWYRDTLAVLSALTGESMVAGCLVKFFQTLRPVPTDHSLCRTLSNFVCFHYYIVFAPIRIIQSVTLESWYTGALQARLLLLLLLSLHCLCFNYFKLPFEIDPKLIGSSPKQSFAVFTFRSFK